MTNNRESKNVSIPKKKLLTPEYLDNIMKDLGKEMIEDD